MMKAHVEKCDGVTVNKSEGSNRISKILQRQLKTQWVDVNIFSWYSAAVAWQRIRVMGTHKISKNDILVIGMLAVHYSLRITWDMEMREVQINWFRMQYLLNVNRAVFEVSWWKWRRRLDP